MLTPGVLLRIAFWSVFGNCGSYAAREPEDLKVAPEALCCPFDLDLEGYLQVIHRGLLFDVCRIGGAKLRYPPMSYRAACNAGGPTGCSFARRTVEAEQKDICFLIFIGNHMSRCGANFRTQVLMHKAQRR
jgi:hypothetical protein